MVLTPFNNPLQHAKTARLDHFGIQQRGQYRPQGELGTCFPNSCTSLNLTL